MTNISRRDAIKFSAVSALGGVALGAALPRIGSKSDVVKCIEAHKIANDEYKAALGHESEIQTVFMGIEKSRPPFIYTPEGAPKLGLEMRLYTPDKATENIRDHYATFRSRISWFPRTSQAKMAAQVDAREEDALNRLEAFYADCQAEEDACGMTAAEERVIATLWAEDEAFLALLASYPSTPEEQALKGEYLRTAWDALQTESGVVEVEERHMSALFEGMGCGVAS